MPLLSVMTGADVSFEVETQISIFLCLQENFNHWVGFNPETLEESVPVNPVDFQGFPGNLTCLGFNEP